MTTLQLIPIVPALTGVLEEFEEAYGFRLHDPALVREVSSQVLAMGSPAPWGRYLAADPDSREVVGTCAFKGAPDSGGSVEIAYFTFPPFEGRGHATAMARALLGVAEGGGARRVVAHTLPEQNPSTRVLERTGFRFVGEVEDPEDGPVWRWERP